MKQKLPIQLKASIIISIIVCALVGCYGIIQAPVLISAFKLSSEYVRTPGEHHIEGFAAGAMIRFQVINYLILFLGIIPYGFSLVNIFFKRKLINYFNFILLLISIIFSLLPFYFSMSQQIHILSGFSLIGLSITLFLVYNKRSRIYFNCRVS